LRIFRGDHDFEAFSAFVCFLLDVCAGNQRGRSLNVKRGPNCVFMTEIAYIKEGGLGSEPFGGGVEAAATRKRSGL
jgi:hypothetical protein